MKIGDHITIFSGGIKDETSGEQKRDTFDR